MSNFIKDGAKAFVEWAKIILWGATLSFTGGAGLTAIACIYYSFPLIFALVGGSVFLVMYLVANGLFWEI